MISAGAFARRHATIVPGSEQPAAVANDVPRAIAVSWLISPHVPLWMTARANNPAAVGEAASQQTPPAPAD